VLDTLPLWLIALLLVLGMTAGYEGGLRLHALLGRGDKDGSDEAYVMSGVFGLLALLMAFSFSLALDRHEHRRALVVDEANAIGTFASRVALLPEAARPEVRRLLREYAALRAEAGHTRTLAGYDRIADRAAREHALVGEHIYRVLGTGPTDTRAALLLQPYNQMGDIATARHAARAASLPGNVMLLLAVYCLLAAAMLGYTLSGTGKRHRLASATLFLLLALAFTTIVDLDRPRDGFIRVPQFELTNVARQLSR